MKVSEKGKSFIKKNEGCVLKAYQCPAKVWTIGYGSTFYTNGKAVKKGDVISQAEADKLFEKVVADFETKVAALIKTNLSQPQFDAMVDMAFNVGIGAFAKSGLLKAINRNANDPNIPSYIMQWNKITIDGKKVAAEVLTTRCKKRVEMYNQK
ncbi:MAG: lysozyme [Sphingobacteriaceae bacterium]|nr:lysozyme [Sphingobacteriaceae bacterium]